MSAFLTAATSVWPWLAFAALVCAVLLFAESGRNVRRSRSAAADAERAALDAELSRKLAAGFAAGWHGGRSR